MTWSVTGPAAGIEIRPFGETAIMVGFGAGIHPTIHRKVKAFTDYLDRCPFPGMIEYITAFASVTVLYDPIKVKKAQPKGKDQYSYAIVSSILQEIAADLDNLAETEPRTVDIPVCYGGQFGPDLAYVAERNQLTADEVIDIHTNGRYLVYMIGFSPGFPFLGGLSKRLATPRRESPRLAIPPGSVGIAGMQTGVYPIETPGGWQLIGRTPLALFRPQDDPPTLLKAGDIVRFHPISRNEYEQYKGDIS